MRRKDPGELDPPRLYLDPDGGKPPARHLPRSGGGKGCGGGAHPIGTMGEPDDIAWAVVWLASDEAKFVTGTEIVIDGGYTAR
jgi:NAD(P)-dependent dehydrogenase (short-subunit alcohol dehydrogenase family)